MNTPSLKSRGGGHSPGSRLWLLILLGLCSPLFVLAQETGTVRGRVLNEITGSFVSNARITAVGTAREAFSDNVGNYQLTLVPVGERTLVITTPSGFTTERTVTVVSGETTRADVTLRPARRGAEGAEEVIELEAFEVQSEADAYATAIAGMRQSPNNVTVVDSGVFGDVAEGNVGEFVKFIPGLSINYTAADVRSIEVRGMGANFTPVTVDGNRMASAASSGGSRTFELEQVSINNVERIEVTKVPTAEMPADSLGGAVNLVSKSAFERDGREIRYKLYLNANSENLTFDKVAWANEEKYAVLPGFDFSYADVFAGGDLGIMLTVLNSNQFNEQHRSRPRWEWDEYGTDSISDPNPIMRRYQFQDGPKFTYRRSYGVRADYRVSDATTLSAGAKYNTYLSQFRNNNVQWDTNVDHRNDVDEDDDEGIATFGTVASNFGGADIDLGGSWRDKGGQTFHTDIALKHLGTNFEAEVGAFFSRATNNYDDVSEGFLEGVSLDYDVPGQITLTDFGGMNGDYEEVIDVSVTERDGTAVPNLGVPDYTGFELLEIGIREVSSVDKFMGANADLTYHLELGEQEVSVSSGVRYTQQDRDNFAPRTRLRFTGSHDLYDPNDFINENYLGEPTGFDEIPHIPLVNHAAVYEFYLANPEAFEEGNRADDNVYALQAGDFEVKEDISAAYLMGQSKFFDNKLSVNAGVRYERTSVDGTALEVDSSGELPVISGTVSQSRSYDGLFPSFNLKYEALPDLVLRFGYAETIGRPDFTDILPLREISDPLSDDGSPGDPSDGEVIVNNTGLEPWEATTYDLTLEYYLGRGGVISASVFRKDLGGVIIDYNKEITQEEIEEFDLPERTLGYNLESAINGSEGKVTGLELSFVYSFKHNEQVPALARGFTLFANGTWQDVEGDFGAGLVDELPGFVDRVINFGVTYQNKWGKAQVKYNIRGRKLIDPTTTGRLTYLFYHEEFPTLDVNFEARISKYATVFLNGRNLLEEPQERIFVGQAPYKFTLLDRNERFGVQWTLGVKGTF
jgi:iron complex outermembrane recepter protein